MARRSSVMWAGALAVALWTGLLQPVAAEAAKPAGSPASAAHLPKPRPAEHVHGSRPDKPSLRPTQAPVDPHSKAARHLKAMERRGNPFANSPMPKAHVPALVRANRAKLKAQRASGQLADPTHTAAPVMTPPEMPLDELPKTPAVDADDLALPDGTAADAAPKARMEATTPQAAAAQPDGCAGPTYCAVYTPGAMVVPTYLSAGSETVTIKNKGTATWTQGSFWLGYFLYKDGVQVSAPQQLTPLGTSVATNQSVTVTAPIKPVGPGSYVIVWDIAYADGVNGGWFTQLAQPVQGGAVDFVVPYVEPVGTITNPPYDQSTFDTLTPTLQMTTKWDGQQPLHVYFSVCPDSPQPVCVGGNASLALIGEYTNQATASWTVPTGSLLWATRYSLQFSLTEDTHPATILSSPIYFTTVVPQSSQPQLGSADGLLDDQNVNMYAGEYVRSETDLSLSSSPSPLTISRTYNSADSVPHAFGLGWSSELDARWIQNPDGTITVTLPDGSMPRFARNPDGTWAAGVGQRGKLSPAGRTLSVNGTVYDFSAPNGKLASVTRGAQKLEFFQETGLITQVRDGYSGRSIYLTWAGGHVATESTSPTQSGLTWSYSYSGTGSGAYLAGVCSPRSATACETYGYGTPYGGVSRLSLVTPPLVTNTVKVSYAGRYVAQVTYPDGTWTYTRSTPSTTSPLPYGPTLLVTVKGPTQTQYFSFSSVGAVLQRWSVQNTVPVTFLYYPNGQLSGQIDQNYNERDYNYDLYGNVTSILRWRNGTDVVTKRIVRYQTSDLSAGSVLDGLPTDVTDENQHHVTYAYSAVGQVLTQTADTGHGQHAVTTYAYTCQGGAAAPAVADDPTAPTGAVQPCNALASVTSPGGKVTRYSYNRYGDLTRIIDAAGKTSDSTYDAYGRMISVTVTTAQNPAGATTTMAYDGVGNLTQVLGPAVVNPITSASNQLRTDQTYDADGNLTTRTETPIVNGVAKPDQQRSTTYTYDARDRVITVADASGTGAVTTRATYNALGQPTNTWDANGNHHRFDYWSSGQLLTETLDNYVNPDGYEDPGELRDIWLQTLSYDAAGRLADSYDPMGNINYYTYTKDDLLTSEYTSVRMSSGGTRTVTLHQYAYDAAGNILSDTQHSSVQPDRKTVMTYDDGNRRTSATLDPSGLNRQMSYDYDLDGNVVDRRVSDGGMGVSGPFVSRTRQTYDAAGRMIASTVVSPTANRTDDLTTTYGYDALGDATGVTDPRGSGTPLGHVQDDGYTTPYAYDALGRLSSAGQPSAAAIENGTGTGTTSNQAGTTYGYNAFGEVTQTRAANGYTVTTTYDQLGRKVGQSGSATPGQNDAWTEAWTYDANGNAITHTDRRGETTSYSYDALDRLSKITYPPARNGAVAGVALYAYDDNGNLVSYVDPTGAQTTQTFDELGNVTATELIDRVDGSTRTGVTMTYDDFGDVLTRTDAVGTMSSFSYNAAGEVTTATESGHGATTYTYDDAGQLITMKDPTGVKTTNTYDFAGRRTTVTQKAASGDASRSTTFGYDRAGNIEAATNARAYTVTAEWDGRNQLVRQTEPVVHNVYGETGDRPEIEYGYDALGDRTRVTDGNGNITLTAYDNQGRPTSVLLPATPGSTDAASRTTTTVYNAAGDEVTATSPGGSVVASTYDRLGQLTGQTGTAPSTPTVTRSFGYDLDGRMTSYSEPGGTATITYDDRGLARTVTHANDPATYLYYDAAGHPTDSSALDGQVSYHWKNDLLLAVNDEDEADDEMSYTFAYDAFGRRTSQSIHTDAHGFGDIENATESYSYDQFNRLAGVNYTSHGANGSTPGDSGTLAYTWDEDDNLSSQHATGALRNDASNHDYTYDEADRLISDQTTHLPRPGDPLSGVDYTWDGAGNKTVAEYWTGWLNASDFPDVYPDEIVKTHSPTTLSTYDARNRITRSTNTGTGTVSYGYDARGNRTTTTRANSGAQTDTATTFDAFGRLLTDSAMGTGNLTYDALDRLITQPGTSGSLRYNGLAREPIVVNGWQFLRGPSDELLGEIPPTNPWEDNGGYTTVVTDPHGDVVAQLGRDGSVATTTSYDPFGTITTQTGGSSASTGATSLFGWQGSLTNTAAGLVHADARWYEPSSGQFLSADPSPREPTSVASANPYGYGNANPATFSDPTGEWGFSLGALFGLGEGLGELTLGAVFSEVILPAAAITGAVYAGYRVYDYLSSADFSSGHSATANPPRTANPPKAEPVPAAPTMPPPTAAAPPHHVETVTPQPPPPPTIIWRHPETTKVTSTIPNRWSDDKNIYVQTTKTTTWTTTTTNKWSDGTTTYSADPPRTKSKTKTVTIPIINLDHPTHVTITAPAIPSIPLVNGTASATTGTCGNGGSLATCMGDNQAPLPTSPDVVGSVGDNVASTPPLRPEGDEPDDCASVPGASKEPCDGGPSSKDTIHSTVRGGDRGIESSEVMKNAEEMYYDENGNQVYRLSQSGGTSQIVVRNPANGNILTNQLSSDSWIERQIQSGRWYDLQGH